jgi:hypothetical protein
VACYFFDRSCGFCAKEYLARAVSALRFIMELTFEECQSSPFNVWQPRWKKGHNSMIDDIVDLETEVECWEASDETLEIAATAGQDAGYTLAACTGLSVCPG